MDCVLTHHITLGYFCFSVCDWTTQASHHSTSLVVLHLITFLKLLTSTHKTCHFGVALSSRLAIAIWPFVRVAWTLTHTHFLLSPTQTWNPVCLLAVYYIPSLKGIIVIGSVFLISRLFMWCDWRLSHLDWKIPRISLSQLKDRAGRGMWGYVWGPLKLKRESDMQKTVENHFI